MGAREAEILGGTALAVLLVLVLSLLLLLVRERRRTTRVLTAAQAETDLLVDRLDGLTAQLGQLSTTVAAPASYLITDAGTSPEPGVVVPDRVVLSAAVGEPLIKAAALAHGVRRALAPESRNRILFEVRREVRRSRKQRRRELREALRRLQADQRAGQRADQRAGGRAAGEPAGDAA